LTPAKKLAVGKPIRISEFPPSPARGRDWESFLGAIPKGYAQEVSVHHSTAREAILRLEKLHAIPKEEFTVRSRTQGGRSRVYVLHHDLARTPVKDVSTTQTQRVELREGDVERYITSRPSYEHTLPDIQMSLLGRVLHSRIDVSDYHRTSRIVREVRGKIEQQEHGRFIGQLRPDGVMVYRFQKNQ